MSGGLGFLAHVQLVSMGCGRSYSAVAVAATGTLGGSRARVHVEDDRHRPVVHQVHRHPRSEDPGLHGNPELSQRRGEALVERLGLLRARGVGEARPVALLRFGQQCELAYDERRTAGVEERAIESPVRVAEDPQPRDLRRQTVRIRCCVAGGDTEQDAQPGTDRAARYRARAADPLDDSPQADPVSPSS
jgi:hypothetical protein